MKFGVQPTNIYTQGQLVGPILSLKTLQHGLQKNYRRELVQQNVCIIHQSTFKSLLE